MKRCSEIQYFKVSKALGIAFLVLLTTACARRNPEKHIEQVWQGVDGNGTEQVVTLRHEETVWVVSHFEIKPGRFQDRLREDRYLEVEQAQAQVERMATRLSLSPRTEPTSPSIKPYQVFTEVPDQEIWKTTQSWDWGWEVKFSKWIQNEITVDLFNKLKISTDCADLPYLLRWIFARNHGLPVVNRLAGSRQLLSNESFREAWLKLPKAVEWESDRRFLAAINYLMVNTYTHTLKADSYPIHISSETMIPGAIYLNLEQDSGHTQVVYQLNSENQELPPMEMIYSTVPREIRVLFRGTFWESAQPTAASGGFMRFRWPVKLPSGQWGLVPGKEMLHFSVSQYSGDFLGQERSFSEAVEMRIASNYDPLLRLRAGIERLREKTRVRQEFVLKGYRACSNGQCLKDSWEYKNWSTPLRDKSIGEHMVKLDDFVLGKSESRPELTREWNQALASPAVEIVPGRSISIGELRQIWSEHKYSSEPWDPVLKRWGLE